MRYIALFFSTLAFSQPDIVHKREHSELTRDLPLINYTLTYTYFDHFINEITTNRLAQEELIEYIGRIQDDDDVVFRYRSLLTDPSDPLEDYQHRRDEFYFLYSDRTTDYLRDCSFYKGTIQKFFDLLEGINKKAESIFKEEIKEIETREPGITDLLYDESGNLTIATKIIRYNRFRSFERAAPFNIVGKSLIWDERLVLLWDIGCNNYHYESNYCYLLLSYCLIPGHIPSTIEFPKKTRRIR